MLTARSGQTPHLPWPGVRTIVLLWDWLARRELPAGEPRGADRGRGP